MSFVESDWLMEQKWKLIDVWVYEKCLWKWRGRGNDGEREGKENGKKGNKEGKREDIKWKGRGRKERDKWDRESVGREEEGR